MSILISETYRMENKLIKWMLRMKIVMTMSKYVFILVSLAIIATTAINSNNRAEKQIIKCQTYKSARN